MVINVMGTVIYLNIVLNLQVLYVGYTKALFFFYLSLFIIIEYCDKSNCYENRRIVRTKYTTITKQNKRAIFFIDKKFG